MTILNITFGQKDFYSAKYFLPIAAGGGRYDIQCDDEGDNNHFEGSWQKQGVYQFRKVTTILVKSIINCLLFWAKTLLFPLNKNIIFHSMFFWAIQSNTIKNFV